MPAHRGFVLPGYLYPGTLPLAGRVPFFLMQHVSALQRAGLAAALLIVGLLAGPAARAQAPAWAQLSTGVPVTANAFSYVTASATDAAGNVYLAGYFFGSVSFGATVLASNATAGPTAPDGFVAKWNSGTGAFAWAVPLGGPGFDQATAIALGNGAVYIGGYFSGATATFGAFTPANMGSSDGFVAKLTDAGTSASFAWVRPAGGNGADQVTGLAVSGSSVYLAGFYGSTTFTAGGTVLTNAAPGTTDAFVAKLTDAGPTASFYWALGFGGPGTDEARALTVSASGLYVVGDFSSATLSLGATTLLNAAGSPAGTADIFVARLLDAGSSASVGWAVRTGGAGPETGDAIALSGASVYVTGSFSGPTTTVGATVLPNAGGTGGTADVLVAKLADTGATATPVWAVAGGGVGADRPRGVVVRGANVYVAGSYGSPSATFGATVLPSRATTTALDIFAAKLLDSGPGAAYAWAQSAGGVNGESAFSVALTGNRVVVAGGTAPGATFGALAVPPVATNTSAFVATLIDPTLTATALASGSLAFALAPNPARGAATLTLPAQPGAATATLTLLDALGRALRTETVALPAAGLRHDLDLRGLPAGLYALRVAAGPATATRRLLVE